MPVNSPLVTLAATPAAAMLGAAANSCAFMATRLAAAMTAPPPKTRMPAPAAADTATMVFSGPGTAEAVSTMAENARAPVVTMGTSA